MGVTQKPNKKPTTTASSRVVKAVEKYPLHSAIEAQDIKSLTRQLKKSPTHIDKKNASGHSPLMSATICGQLDSVSLLVDAGASLDVKEESSGNSLLMIAAKQGHLKLVKYFITQKLSVTERNLAGHSALDLAKETGKSKIVKILRNQLNKQKISLYPHKKRLKKLPAAELIGVSTSPCVTYMQELPADSPDIKDNETYFRSDKSPLSKKLGKDVRQVYQSDESLRNGARAHVGGYGNSIEMCGDTFEPDLAEEITTKYGTGALYHEVLKHKKDTCEYIVEKYNKKYENSSIEVGYYNQYPCIMVYICENTIFKASKTKAPSNPAKEAWTNLLASYFVAIVNYHAYQAEMPIELLRRSSFGFSMPTIAATEKSFRLSVGIIPREYADIIVKSLARFSEVLDSFSDEKRSLPQDIFYRSKKHQQYLNGRYPPAKLKHLSHVLWAQVDKGGRTTLQNIDRTPYARAGIAAAAFNSLVNMEDVDYQEAFFVGIEWALKKIEVKKTLTFQQDEEFSYEHSVDGCSYISKDENFWRVIESITKAARTNRAEIFNTVIAKLQDACDTKELNELYYLLEMLNELIFVHAIERSEDVSFGDGYGSDSDEEADIEEQTVYAKKIITHNGMRAIWAAVTASVNYLNARGLLGNIYFQTGYYEVGLGLADIQRLEDLPDFYQTAKISEAAIIFHDVNACVTDGEKSGKNFILRANKEKFDNKVVILDVTSATADEVHQYIAKFTQLRAKILFLVSSGLKNEQLGAAKNPYGTIRIFTKNKKTRDLVYEEIKKNELPILSGTSHFFRRQMKKMGAVPVNREYLTPQGWST